MPRLVPASIGPLPALPCSGLSKGNRPSTTCPRTSVCNSRPVVAILVYVAPTVHPTGGHHPPRTHNPWHCGGKSPYHGLITVPSIGPPFPAHPAGATQVPVGVRRKAADTSSLCPHSPRSNSLMVALTTASNGPAIRYRCACSPVWEQLLMTCHAEPPPGSSEEQRVQVSS